MTANPTPPPPTDAPPPDELAKRIREWRAARTHKWHQQSCSAAILLTNWSEAIASALEENATLRRQLAQADAVINLMEFGWFHDLDPGKPPDAFAHNAWKQRAIARHASRAGRKG